MTTLPSIDASVLANLMRDERALLVDVREPNEFAAEHIKGAVSTPLSQLGGEPLNAPSGRIVVFHCKSGMRTQTHCARLATLTTAEAYILDGGIEAWKRAGYAVESGQGDGRAQGPSGFARLFTRK